MFPVVAELDACQEIASLNPNGIDRELAFDFIPITAGTLPGEQIFPLATL
jgi:hypothetical protein